MSVIASGFDDVEQQRNGPFVSDGASLAMRSDTLVGMRYYVCIPAGATVTEAWLQVTADTDDVVPSDARIRAERVADSESFETNPSIIGRLASDTEVAWTIPPFVQNTSYDTPDISALVNEIIGLPGWTGCGSMLFVFEEVGQRNLTAYDGSPADAPVLNINTNP